MATSANRLTTVSYSSLIADHRDISIAVAGLLRSLAADTPDLASIQQRFGRLAGAVGDHIAVELPLASSIDPRRLADPWRERWLVGKAAYDALCTAWQPFIAKWDDAAIERDLAGFREALHDLVRHLDTRMEFEAETFYAVLCQSRVISMA